LNRWLRWQNSPPHLVKQLTLEQEFSAVVLQQLNASERPSATDPTDRSVRYSATANRARQCISGTTRVTRGARIVRDDAIWALNVPGLIWYRNYNELFDEFVQLGGSDKLLA